MKSARQQDYSEKFPVIVEHTLFHKLSDSDRAFIEEKAYALRLTQQELRELCQMANDLAMWKEPGLETFWPLSETQKKPLMAHLRLRFQEVQAKLKSYAGFAPGDKPAAIKPRLVRHDKGELGLVGAMYDVTTGKVVFYE
mgnify:CR=1 FL=1